MNEEKTIKKILFPQPTTDGAGVKLKRVFGYHQVPLFDPFLMLDDFGTDNPEDYIAGFPWHPHRGIITVTYMIDGKVRHEDSLGNNGVISAGDIQWMKAGRGIIHQEMPEQNEGKLKGFQLWINLPAEQKMSRPDYQDIRAKKIPIITESDGRKIKIIAGELPQGKGPVKDPVTSPLFLDITLSPGEIFRHKISPGQNTFAYVIEGSGYFTSHKNKPAEGKQVILYNQEGSTVHIEGAGKTPLKFLLLAGTPINEPVAWNGPIVMNTLEELETAFNEYKEGTFIKDKCLTP